MQNKAVMAFIENVNKRTIYGKSLQVTSILSILEVLPVAGTRSIVDQDQK